MEKPETDKGKTLFPTEKPDIYTGKRQIYTEKMDFPVSFLRIPAGKMPPDTGIFGKNSEISLTATTFLPQSPYQASQRKGVTNMNTYDSGVQWDSGARWDEQTTVPQPEKTQKMAKVKIGLKDASKEEILAKGKVLIENLTGSATYPNADVAGLQTQVDDAESTRDTRSMTDVEQRNAVAAENAAFEALYQAIVGIAAHVDDVSGGDPEKIAESGFETRAAAAPVGELPAPVDFLATTGDMAGEIDMVWSPVDGARSYAEEYREDVDGSEWVKGDTSFKSKDTLTGLVPGTAYRVRVAAKGTAGQSPWSDESICRAG